MARAPKNPRKGGRSVTAKATGEADTGKTDKTTHFRAPAAEHVVKSVRRLKSMAGNVQTASGEMGEFVNSLCEKHHYDKKALGLVRQLERMPDERLAITLPHLLKYIDDLGLGARAEQQGKLIEDDMPDAEDANAAVKEAADTLAGRRPRMQLVPGEEAERETA